MPSEAGEVAEKSRKREIEALEERKLAVSKEITRGILGKASKLRKEHASLIRAFLTRHDIDDILSPESFTHGRADFIKNTLKHLKQSRQALQKGEPLTTDHLTAALNHAKEQLETELEMWPGRVKVQKLKL